VASNVPIARTVPSLVQAAFAPTRATPILKIAMATAPTDVKLILQAPSLIVVLAEHPAMFARTLLPLVLAALALIYANLGSLTAMGI
jgi:hypothetical protein